MLDVYEHPHELHDWPRELVTFADAVSFGGPFVPSALSCARGVHCLVGLSIYIPFVSSFRAQGR